MIPAAAKTAALKVAEWSAFAAVFGWIGGLWIDSEVERRMDELATDPSKHPAVVQLQTEMVGVKESQARIELKVDTFSTKFLEYLERQSQ